MPFAERYAAETKARYGENDAKYATAIDSLASLHYKQGRYAEAAPLYRQALAIRERVLGPGHWLTYVSVNNLGNALSNQARYEEARDAFQKSAGGIGTRIGCGRWHDP